MLIAEFVEVETGKSADTLVRHPQPLPHWLPVAPGSPGESGQTRASKAEAIARRFGHVDPSRPLRKPSCSPAFDNQG
jgi:hypothetical protein